MVSDPKELTASVWECETILVAHWSAGKEGKVEHINLPGNVAKFASTEMDWDVLIVMDNIMLGKSIGAKDFGIFSFHSLVVKVICRVQARATHYSIWNVTQQAWVSIWRMNDGVRMDMQVLCDGKEAVYEKKVRALYSKIEMCRAPGAVLEYCMLR